MIDIVDDNRRILYLIDAGLGVFNRIALQSREYSRENVAALSNDDIRKQTIIYVGVEFAKFIANNETGRDRSYPTPSFSIFGREINPLQIKYYISPQY